MTDYSLYGATPTTVLRPKDIDELSADVRRAYNDGAAIVPWGNGSRQHIGAAPTRYDIALVITDMNRIVEHNPADLVVTVEAGASLGVLQEALAPHGQWLPWDPPAPPEATIGGLLASAASGPLRLGFGSPRDWTLGMRVVLPDGRSVKSGSKVVKNVAGYDAHKLHLGALGTLGIIAEVTFKLAPLPAVHRSLMLQASDLPAALRAMELLRAAPLAPISLLVLNERMARLAVPQFSGQILPEQALVVARYAGVAAAVDRQLATASARLSDFADIQTTLLEGDNDLSLWKKLSQIAAGGREGMLLRAGGRPSDLAALSEALVAPAHRRGWSSPLALYGGVGLTYARWPNADDAPAALAEARALLPTESYTVVEDAPALLRSSLDLWGPSPNAIGLMQALKAQWNERDLINRGRYLV